MIKIVVEKVRVSSGFEAITQQMVNVAAQGFANVMKENGLEQKSCSAHPAHTSTVVVKAVERGNKSLAVIKRGFCCKDFEDSVQINIT